MAQADFHIKQNDTSPAIESQLQDESGNPVDITGFNEIEFHLKSPTSDSVKVDSDTSSGVIATDEANGMVKYDWSSGDTDTAGRFHGEWQVTYSDGSTETFPNSDYIEIRILEELI